MSDFDSLREDFANAFAAISDYAQAQRRHAVATTEEIERLWADNAALRDELHALANRVESLTRARLTEPAEVAEQMIFTCPVSAGCNLSRPHVHREDGAVIYVTAAEDARRYYAQRDERDALLRAHRGGDAA